MLTEGLLKSGVVDLHILLREFFEEIQKDFTIVEIVEGKTNEKFEKYRSRILDIFSKYNDGLCLLSYITPEDKFWRSISFFYPDIAKLLIDECKDKKSIGIMLNKAADLQAD